MNDQTQFHLDQAIQQWRDKLGRSPAIRAENLNELEAHLRDSVASLQTRGLSEEEAFLIAQKRLGHAQDLEPEFRKMNQSSVWLDRVLWMLIGLQVWMLVSTFLGRVAHGALILILSRYDYSVSHRAFSLVAFVFLHMIVFICSLALCWWLIVRKGHRFAKWFVRFSTGTGKLMALGLLLWVSSVVVLSLAGLFQALPLTRLYTDSAGRLSLFMTAAAAWMQIMTPAALIAVTLVLARKRLGKSSSPAAT